MGFGLIETSQEAPKKINNGANAEGQIKIDLSVKLYGGSVWRWNKDGTQIVKFVGVEEWEKDNIKPPSLKKIMQVLKTSGAKILRIYGEGRFTVIDYIT